MSTIVAPLEEHFHAAVVRDDGDGRRREVLLRGEGNECVDVLFVHDDRHALL